MSRKWLHLQWILWHFAFSLYFKSCSVVNYSQLKVFIASKFNFFFCGIASYTIRIYCTFRKQATEEEYFTFWWVKLICCCWTFSKFQDVIKHVDFKLRPKKGLYGSFEALSYSDVMRKWPCQPWKERKIGVSWNFHCSEICISNVVWQLIILTRTRNGELAFRPYSTFPLPDIAKITNRIKKGNKK